MSPRGQAGSAFIGRGKLLRMDFHLQRGEHRHSAVARLDGSCGGGRGARALGGGGGQEGRVPNQAVVKEGRSLDRGVRKQRWAPKDAGAGLKLPVRLRMEGTREGTEV